MTAVWTGPNVDKSRVGIYIGVTEHGNVETENEIFQLKGFDYDTSYWSHHHNPRTVANNPAGEVALNMEVTGPHYTIGAACAAGNAGLIQGSRCCGWANATLRLGRRRLGEHSHVRHLRQLQAVRVPWPSTKIPTRASRPFDRASDRDRRRRRRLHVRAGATGRRSPAGRHDPRRAGRLRHEHRRHGFRVAQCRRGRPNVFGWRLKRAGLVPEQIDLVSTHATGTTSGDTQECAGLREVFGKSERTYFNNTKSFIGHSMGAAGALELAGNLPSFRDGNCHATINVEELDPDCELSGLVVNQPREVGKIQYMLNNSFGMLGINSVLIVKKF